VCTNKVPGVIHGHTQRGPSIAYRFIYMFIHVAKSLENLLLINHWPECFLNWLGATFISALL